MPDNPELLQATPEKNIHATERALKNIHEEKQKLYSEVYKKSKDIDAPTDADWHDIFSELQVGHADVLNDLQIDSPELLKDFALQRQTIFTVHRKIADNKLSELEAEKLLKESPQILTEAYMRCDMFDIVSDGYHAKNIDHLGIISRLSDPKGVIRTIAQETDFEYIYINFTRLQPYGFLMLHACLEAQKKPYYQDDFRDALSSLESQDVSLSNDQVDTLKKFFIQDDSPEAHQSRLFYTLPDIKITPPSLSDELALQGLMNTQEEWIDFTMLAREATPEVKTQARAMISRNLYFQQLPVNEENVRREWLRIINARQEYRDKPIFEGRNFLMLAHGEKLASYEVSKEIHGDDTARFGRNALMHAISMQQGEGQMNERIRPKDTGNESAIETKINAIERIKAMPPPTTFFFDMHGSPEAVYFSDGELSEEGVKDGDVSIKITVDELADCFCERATNFGERLRTKEERDIIVSGSCFSSTFIRNFYSKLGDAPKPIFLGSSEYNSYGISSSVEPTGSKFTAKILDVENTTNNAITTFGDVFDNELRGLEVDDRGHDTRTNPSMYIPDDNNQIMQITRNVSERKDGEKPA